MRTEKSQAIIKANGSQDKKIVHSEWMSIRQKKAIKAIMSSHKKNEKEWIQRMKDLMEMLTNDLTAKTNKKPTHSKNAFAYSKAYIEYVSGKAKQKAYEMLKKSAKRE